MKMAKASQQDLDAANQVASHISDLEKGFMPSTPDGDGGSELFDRNDPDDCMLAMHTILDAAEKGSLFRVTFGMQVVCDPRNKVVDPDADCLEIHPEHTANADKVADLTARVADLEMDAKRYRYLREQPTHAATLRTSEWYGPTFSSGKGINGIALDDAIDAAIAAMGKGAA